MAGSFEFGGEDGEGQRDEGDRGAGDGKLAVAEAGGEHDAADRGSDGVAEIEGSLV